MFASSTNHVLIADGHSRYEPRWSPDSRLLVYDRERVPTILDTASGLEQPLRNSKEISLGDWSPAGFRATIGFALVETLLASGITVDVNQFHHYPGGTRMLPPQLFDGQLAAIVGEFATAANDVWPELGIHGQSVLNRLRRAQALGYPLTIAWSFLARDRRTSWSRAVERDVVAFARQ